MDLILWSGLLIFTIACSSPGERLLDEMRPAIDCHRQLDNCLRGKKKSRYTMDFCNQEFDKCELEYGE